MGEGGPSAEEMGLTPEQMQLPADQKTVEPDNTSVAETGDGVVEAPQTSEALDVPETPAERRGREALEKEAHHKEYLRQSAIDEAKFNSLMRYMLYVASVAVGAALGSLSSDGGGGAVFLAAGLIGIVAEATKSK